jgi:hypothetical protein
VTASFARRGGKAHEPLVGRIVHSALIYWGIVFALGFALGTVRVLVVIPQLGSETLAVALELPLMLAGSWIAARWLIRRKGPFIGVERALIGALAFAILMVAEAALAGIVFDERLSARFASLTTLPDLLGLSGQLVFAAMPLLVGKSPGLDSR